MLFENYECNGYQVLRVRQESPADIDFCQIEEHLERLVSSGANKVALSLSINAYPYSRLISFLVRCNKSLVERGGCLAVIQPNQDFLDVMKKTNLSRMFPVVSGDGELANLP